MANAVVRGWIGRLLARGGFLGNVRPFGGRPRYVLAVAWGPWGGSFARSFGTGNMARVTVFDGRKRYGGAGTRVGEGALVVVDQAMGWVRQKMNSIVIAHDNRVTVYTNISKKLR